MKDKKNENTVQWVKGWPAELPVQAQFLLEEQ